MKIFINDIPVNIIRENELKPDHEYDLIMDGSEGKIKPKSLIDDVLIRDASPDNVEELLKVMTDNKLKKVFSITFACKDKKEVKKYIKSKFKVVKAAGGVVEKQGLILLIYRKGRWDIPKGKRDKKEGMAACAVREVEEETGVKVTIDRKVMHTWHTYVNKKKYILKKTNWYAMSCLDDSKMAPQEEESIDEVKWMNLTEQRAALYGSYRSIRVVMQEYHKLLRDYEGMWAYNE